MTFTELRTEILDRLNLSSSEATTRVGRAINRKYRLVTSSIGLQLSRRTTVSQAVTLGVSTVTFSGVEKIINVINRTTTPYRLLTEVTIDELSLEKPFAAADAPTKYAVASHTADTVTILINRVPQTAFTLYADAHSSVSDLSGSNEPAFPESYHDVIIEGVLSDELRKMEKPVLAQIAQREYERILSDLKFWIAKSGFLDIYQGKTEKTSRFGPGGGGAGSGTVPDGTASYTQTGLITFDRDPSAPFAVSASSAKVDNLDADKLDGQTGADYHDATLLTGVTDETNGGTGQSTITQGDLLYGSASNVISKLAKNASATRYLSNTGTSNNPAWAQINLPDGVTGNLPIANLGNGVTTTVSSTATGTQNNWAPGLAGDTYIGWSGASALTVTGFAGGVTGQRIVFRNNNSAGSGLDATFPYLSGSSVAANQLFNTVVEISTVVAPGGHAEWIYNSAVWVMVSHEQGSAVSYTPTWGNTGTANTLGNGQLLGAYSLKGKTIFFTITLTFGSTTVSGNGSWTFSIPAVANVFVPAATLTYYDIGTASYLGFNTTVSTSVIGLVFPGASGIATAVTATAPFTWVTNDITVCQGWYPIS